MGLDSREMTSNGSCEIGNGLSLHCWCLMDLASNSPRQRCPRKLHWLLDAFTAPQMPLLVLRSGVGFCPPWKLVSQPSPLAWTPGRRCGALEPETGTLSGGSKRQVKHIMLSRLSLPARPVGVTCCGSGCVLCAELVASQRGAWARALCCFISEPYTGLLSVLKRHDLIPQQLLIVNVTPGKR